MQTYTKINSLYKRYQKLNGKNVPLPDNKWRKFSNAIILGNFSDPTIAYLKDNQWEATSKIDGTNSKIAYYPSTGKIAVGGKTDKAESLHGQFEFLQSIGERILPQLREMFPAETAKFEAVKDETTNKVAYFDIDSKQPSSLTKEGMYGVQMAEVPIYIYGEYFGNGVQKVGKRYSKNNDFAVFDICLQGWYIPTAMRNDICQKLGLRQVPYLGMMSIVEAENYVRKGFPSHVEGADASLLEEGIVLRSPVNLKDSHSNRLIVKIKHCDYNRYDLIRKEFSDEEFEQFNNWYSKNIENIK